MERPSGTGISPARTSLRATEGGPPGTRAPAVGFVSRSRSAGARGGGEGSCRRIVRGDRWIQAGSCPAPPGPRHRRGELLARRRSRGLDRHPLDANGRAGNGVRAKLVAGGTARTLWIFARGTGPALWAFGQLGQSAIGAPPGSSRSDPGARPPWPNRSAWGSQVSGAVGARQPPSLSGPDGSDRGHPAEQPRSGDPLPGLSNRELGDPPAPARGTAGFSQKPQRDASPSSFGRARSERQSADRPGDPQCYGSPGGPPAARRDLAEFAGKGPPGLGPLARPIAARDATDGRTFCRGDEPCSIKAPELRF